VRRYVLPRAALLGTALWAIPHVVSRDQEMPWWIALLLAISSGIWLHFRIRRRLIAWFSYNQGELRYLTATARTPRILHAADLVRIEDLRSHVSWYGYQLVFPETELMFVMATENSRPLYEQLRRDRWPDRTSTL
jgi:hypothetical protein